MEEKYMAKKKVEAEGILDEAKRITDGDRARDYDSPENNFRRISNYWNVYLEHKGYYGGFGDKGVTPKDVAMMMILMKLAREDHKHKRDNLVDACGYARCAAKIEGDE